MNRIIDIKIVEGSVTEPLTLAQVKTHLIITSADDDTQLTSFITQCRKAIEEFCAISIVAKTITLTADLWREWELPYGPVTGIQSVATRTGDQGSGPGMFTTLTTGWDTSGEEFISFRPSGFGYFNPMAPFTGYFQWGPEASPYSYGGNRYKIIYTAGFTTVPDNLKLAILNEISYRYAHRGNETLSIISGICEPAQGLAFPFKRQLWF